MALGWHSMGDFSEISPTREAFKETVAQAYPHKKELIEDAGEYKSTNHDLRHPDTKITSSHESQARP